MPIGPLELYKRANVMAANQAGLLDGDPAAIDDSAVGAQVEHSFMMSALIYRVSRPDEPAESVIEFIMSDDFLVDGMAADLAETDWFDTSKTPEFVGSIRGYLTRAAPLIEEAVDNPTTLRDFRRGYLTACQIAVEIGCEFEEVFTDDDSYNSFCDRLDSDPIPG